MRFRQNMAAKRDRLKQWHRWFAWRPTQTDDCIAWLEYVHRKDVFSKKSDKWEWEYCSIERDANDRELMPR